MIQPLIDTLEDHQKVDDKVVYEYKSCVSKTAAKL